MHSDDVEHAKQAAAAARERFKESIGKLTITRLQKELILHFAGVMLGEIAQAQRTLNTIADMDESESQ